MINVTDLYIKKTNHIFVEEKKEYLIVSCDSFFFNFFNENVVDEISNIVSLLTDLNNNYLILNKPFELGIKLKNYDDLIFYGLNVSVDGLIQIKSNNKINILNNKDKLEVNSDTVFIVDCEKFNIFLKHFNIKKNLIKKKDKYIHFEVEENTCLYFKSGDLYLNGECILHLCNVEGLGSDYLYGIEREWFYSINKLIENSKTFVERHYHTYNLRTLLQNV